MKFSERLSVVFDNKDFPFHGKLNEDLIWHLDDCSEIVIPTGFVSNGFSVPRIFWCILNPWPGTISKASILHDYLLILYYRKIPHPRFTTKSAIDAELKKALISCGLDKFSANVIWMAIRLHSWINNQDFT